MLKEHATIYRRLMMGMDAFIVGLCFLYSFALIQNHGSAYFLSQYLWMMPTLMIFWVGLFYFSGLYHSFRLKSVGIVIWNILKAAFTAFFAFGSIIFVFNLPYINRSFVLYLFAIVTYAFILERVILIILFRFFRKRGLNFRSVLIVGTGGRAQKFLRELESHPELGLKVIGFVDDPSDSGGNGNGHGHGNGNGNGFHDPQDQEDILGYKIIGHLKDIPQLIRDNAIDYVVFIVPRSWLGKIEEPIHYCETVGVTASVAVDLFDLHFTMGKESRLFNVPLLTFDRTTDRIGQLLFKRIIDIALSGLALVLLLPFFGIIALLIKLTSPGPVFFRQNRCGLNGRQFVLYKFRTMSEDAEAKLESLRHLNEMDGPVFKIENDPRVTALGKFLRKFSLDELPQLWNVFQGEMSLVGPRPPIINEVAQYDHWQRRRLSMRPGITCLWQVNGRNQITDFNKWMRLDLDYIDHWSLWLDFGILLKTIPVVLFAKGAK